MLGLITYASIAFAPATLAVDVISPGVCDRYAKASEASKPAVCKDNNITGDDGKQENPIFGPNGIITRVISILSVVVAVIAIITIILAGLKFISSGNNPQEVGKAREAIIYAIVGLLVAASAQVFVKFIVGRVF